MSSTDWFMRQCETVGRMLGIMLFNKHYEEDMLDFDDKGNVSEGEMLLYILRKRVKEGDINSAENLLFEEIDKNKSPAYLQTALDFYKMLEEMTDASLASCRFSREEIYEGLAQVMDIYGIPPEERAHKL